MTDNPAGSTREQLPADILAILDGLLPDYTSTACHTADALAVAAHLHPRADELRAHAERLHSRCRLNHKFTGHLCVCGCHPEPEPSVCDAYQLPTTAAASGLCARCGMSDYKHQEQPRV